MANPGKSIGSKGFRSFGYRWSEDGCLGGGKRKADTAIAYQALCYRSSPNILSLLVVTLVKVSSIFYRVGNRDSERLSNLSKDTLPGSSRPGIPAPILLNIHHIAVASGLPTSFPGSADSTVSVLLPSLTPSTPQPSQLLATAPHFLSTSQQAVRATFHLSAREAEHLRATNRPGPQSPHDSKTELLG